MMNQTGPGAKPLSAMSLMAKKRIPRRAIRYAVRWALTELNGQPVRDGWVVDVSSLGARLETTQALGVRCPVKVAVRLPDNRGEVIISGQVVWSRPLFSPPGRFHQGIQFFGPNWELEQLAKTMPG